MTPPPDPVRELADTARFFRRLVTVALVTLAVVGVAVVGLALIGDSQAKENARNECALQALRQPDLDLAACDR